VAKEQKNGGKQQIFAEKKRIHMQTINPGPPRRLAILGSTGSIGRQTLDVVRAFPEAFQVVVLAARNNVDLLLEQVHEFQPALVVCTADDQETCRRVRDSLPDVLCSPDGLLAAATHPDIDIVVVALSGVGGVKPTLAALVAGKQVALANKETMVLAGHLVAEATRGQEARVLPVDSEHSAIWQCLRGEHQAEVRRLLLTASGGPFRRASYEEMSRVRVEQALAHPTWDMGPKITIDSATLMNKGLEVIEAHWLFAIPYEKIEVVVHPQSIIHSMVEFVDNSIKMQASLPSMHLPIQDALSYPHRFNRAGTSLERELRWSQIGHLDFEEVDRERFPGLGLAYEAGRQGGTAPAVLTGADEQAVALFLQGKLRLTEIVALVEKVLFRHRVLANPNVETVIEACAWAQEEVLRLCNQPSGTCKKASTGVSV
jgi:1-deoxy-D-xylulose-5-phosphate reductoisomerase